MPDFLDRALAASRKRVAESRQSLPEAVLRERVLSTPPPPPLRLDGRFDLIAEIKLASPSEGALAPSDADPDFVVRRAASFAKAGAAAVSVLTEPEFFSGSLEHLSRASAAISCPTMRKDFLVDPYQVFEARAAGAGGVLVILRAGDDALIREIVDAAREAGLFVLLEAFDEQDLEALGRVLEESEGATILAGINTRDLATLGIDARRLADAAQRLPRSVPWVAESGLGSAEQVAEAAALGYRLALVGTALSRSTDPERSISDLLAAGRGALRT